MKVIIYQDNLAEPVKVVYPAPAWTGSMDELAAKVVPPGVTYEVVESAVIPTDRRLRNAWDMDGKRVAINREKAAAVVLERANFHASKALEALERDIVIDIAQGRDVTDKVAKRDKLRTLPNVDFTNASLELMARAVDDYTAIVDLPRKASAAVRRP